MKPDFSIYSLALFENGKIVYSSNHSGLRPLVLCLSKYKEGPYELHDKVIGLAAAKLIVNSNVIKTLKTNLISKPALDYLKGLLELDYRELVENILTKDKTDICPMEKKAIELPTKDFINHIRTIFR